MPCARLQFFLCTALLDILNFSSTRNLGLILIKNIKYFKYVCNNPHTYMVWVAMLIYSISHPHDNASIQKCILIGISLQRPINSF